MHSKTILALTLTTLGALTPTLAHAEDSPSHAPASPPASTPAPASASPLTPETTTSWYGYQTLLVDGLAVTMLYASAKANSNGPLAAGSAATFALGAPAVHAAHGRPGAMGVDIALRVGLPLAFAGIGYAAGDKSCKDCFMEPAFFTMVLGFMIGAGTAVVVDAAVIAREKVPAPRAGATDEIDHAKELERERAREATKVRITPTASIVPGGASAGVVGSF